MANKLEINTVLAIANAELGYLEKASNAYLDDKTKNAGKNNYTKYWRDLKPSFQGQSWCNCFVNWCFVKAYGEADAKKLLCSTTFSYYTPESAKFFYNKKQWYTEPKVGDVIYFRNDASEKEGRWKGIHHVGIVYKVSGNIVYTIEGNTGAGTQVIPNGGGVCAKSYTWKNSKTIAGYGRPKYTAGQIVDIPVTCYRTGVKIVGAASLNIRKGPGTDYGTAGSYKKDVTVQVTAKSLAPDGVYWFKTDKGYISGKYIQGWVKENNGLWWYIKEGYKYDTLKVVKIDNDYFAFDKDGWLITSERVGENGVII